MLYFVTSILLVCLLTFDVADAKRNKTSLQKQIDELRGEFEAFKNDKSSEKPYFGAYIQDGDWLLAFRLVAGNKQPGYDSFTDVNRNDDDPLVRALTPCSCLAANGTCTRHYRGSILTQWSQLPISKVRLSIYEGGRQKAFAVFNGAGSSFSNWFSADRLEDSSWTDLKTSSKNYFSVAGDIILNRRFLISSGYLLCAGDSGWLAVKDANDVCSWGQLTTPASFPLILYSTTGTKARYQSTAFSRADSLAVWVTLKEPEDFGESCF